MMTFMRKVIRKIRTIESFVTKQERDVILELGDVRLIVANSDQGGHQYKGSNSFQELATNFYKEIQSRYNPSLVIDVGANYGFTGIVFARSFPNAKIVLIEASSRLEDYIGRNFELNGFTKGFEIIHAKCAEVSKQVSRFSLNPHSSQDNRVIPENPNWQYENVPQICIDDILSRNSSQEFVFVKIDTQGYEQRVISGFNKYLLTNKNWLIKTEFAPYWLRSQETDPFRLLEDWILKFNVCEIPARLRFKGDKFDSILQNPIEKSEIENFIEYIENQNTNHRGWCDLLLSPK
jgi:FkbM family methyltransferase